jgi:hypothetical protein
VVPGLVKIASTGVKAIGHVGEGINKIHTDYTLAKKNGKKYSFKDGLKSGVEGFKSSLDGTLDTSDSKKDGGTEVPIEGKEDAQKFLIDQLTKGIGQLSSRISLKK